MEFEQHSIELPKYIGFFSNMRLIRQSLVLVLFSSYFSAFGAEKGSAVVEHNLPFLYASVMNTFGQIRGEGIFREWTYEDCIFFAQKTRHFLRNVQSAEGDPQKLTSVLDRYHNSLIGTFGEAIGLSLLRSKHRDNPAIKIIDELQYTIQNNSIFEQNGRPDGIAYHIHGDTVCIVSVLEAKMSKGLSNRQISGWLSRWQEKGLTLSDQHFPPEKIFFQVSGVTIPLRIADTPSIRPILFGVTRANGSRVAGETHRVGFSVKESKTLTTYLAEEASSPSALDHLKDLVGVAENALVVKMIERIDSGEVSFPSQKDGPEGKFSHEIQYRFSGVVGLYNALPPEYQKKLRDYGFNPAKPVSSSRYMKGLSVWTSSTAMAEMVRRIDGGQYFPSVSGEPSERSLANSIHYFFGTYGQLFSQLPPESQKKLKEMGFDPDHPISSGKLLAGSAIYTRNSVLRIMMERIERGNTTIPSTVSSDEEGALGRALAQKFRRLELFFVALPLKHQGLLLQAGFDVKNVRISTRRMRGAQIPEKATILEKIKKRIDAGLVYLPSRKGTSDKEEVETAKAVYSLFRTQKKLFEALPSDYQQKLMSTGYDPARPRARTRTMKAARRDQCQETFEKVP